MIRVYGASDDLLEVAGAIEEEFYFKAEHEHNYLAFSDGTVLAANYDSEGMWRIHRVHAGTARCDHYPAGQLPEDEHDCPEYSDLIRLTRRPGDPRLWEWVVYGHEKAKVKR